MPANHPNQAIQTAMYPSEVVAPSHPVVRAIVTTPSSTVDPEALTKSSSSGCSSTKLAVATIAIVVAIILSAAGLVVALNRGNGAVETPAYVADAATAAAAAAAAAATSTVTTRATSTVATTKELEPTLLGAAALEAVVSFTKVAGQEQLLEAAVALELDYEHEALNAPSVIYEEGHGMKIRGALEGMPFDQLKDAVVDAARRLISAEESKGPGELERFFEAAVFGAKVSEFAENASRAELTEAMVDLELDFEHEFTAAKITKLLHDSVIDRIDTIPLDDLRAVFIGSANLFFAQEQSIGPAAFATFFANKQRRRRRAKRARGAAGIPTSTVATGLDKNGNIVLGNVNSLQIGGGVRRQLRLGPAYPAAFAFVEFFAPAVATEAGAGAAAGGLGATVFGAASDLAAGAAAWTGAALGIANIPVAAAEVVPQTSKLWALLAWAKTPLAFAAGGALDNVWAGCGSTQHDWVRDLICPHLPQK